MFKQCLSFITLIWFASCGSSNHESSDASSNSFVSVAEYEEMPITRQESARHQDVPIEIKVQSKKIIRDGRMQIEVASLADTKSLIDTLLNSSGGYYANESFDKNDYQSSYSLKIRVPSAKFDTFIKTIESGGGDILFKEIGARDVTDQFIDLESRLTNKRNYLQRYNELLKQAKSVSEILEIQERIRVLEEEVESTVGRLKYLTDQVDFSTLDLTISLKKEYKYNPEKRDRFGERFKQSLSKGWFGFVDFLLFIIKIWPLWIILVVSYAFWKRFRTAKNK